MTLTPFTTRSTRVRLTNAQILALPTTPIQIVAAPASGLVLVPLGVTYRAAFDHGAYTNADPAAVLIIKFLGDTVARFGPSYFLPDAARWDTGAVGFLNRHDAGRSGLRRISDQLASFAATKLVVAIDNAAAGNLTGGHSSNVMDVTVTYRVAERPPSVGVFADGDGWKVTDGNTTNWPDAYIVTRNGGGTFVVDDEAPGGLTLSIVSSRPVVTYP